MPVMTSGITVDDSDSTRMNEQDELKSVLFADPRTDICMIVDKIDWQSLPNDDDDDDNDKNDDEDDKYDDSYHRNTSENKTSQEILLFITVMINKATHDINIDSRPDALQKGVDNHGRYLIIDASSVSSRTRQEYRLLYSFQWSTSKYVR